MVSIVRPTNESFVLNDRAMARAAEAERARDDADDQARLRANVAGAIVLVALTLFGLWLVDTMVSAEKAHGCFSSGEHTCSPI